MRLTKLAAQFVKPVGTHEDARRQEFILNVLLLSLITLLVIATASSVVFSFFASATDQSHNAMPVFELLFVLGLFVLLYIASRKGYARSVSLVFIALLAAFAVNLACTWGPDLPSAILFYALIIAVSGVLINSRFAFMVTIVLGVIVSEISFLQENHYLHIDTYWRTETFGVTDSLIISVILLIIATISWLSNRETERSLVRARSSELALKEERDLLEIRVEERTQELRKVEMERISQSYRFIEFGRVASGIFHDFTNPLTSIALTIENISNTGIEPSENNEYVSVLTQDIAQAKRATIHMQNLLGTMRRHLAHENLHESFSLVGCARDIVSMLTSYARQRAVELVLEAPDDIEYFGSQVAFTQILTNLVSNAIESFPVETKAENREVLITLNQIKNQVVLSVSDNGAGIASEFLDKIFEPFVSTKSASGGLGIGLSLVKQLIEKELHGTIAVQSIVGEGATFTVQFPVREP